MAARIRAQVYKSIASVDSRSRSVWWALPNLEFHHLVQPVAVTHPIRDCDSNLPKEKQVHSIYMEEKQFYRFRDNVCFHWKSLETDKNEYVQNTWSNVNIYDSRFVATATRRLNSLHTGFRSNIWLYSLIPFWDSEIHANIYCWFIDFVCEFHRRNVISISTLFRYRSFGFCALTIAVFDLGT